MQSETLESQISRLATFILQLDAGYPNASEGAVDTAIRMLKNAYVGTPAD